ncbi:MAG: 5,10-methylenetetrahydrofolate reductase, partial [uncultured Rubellimicrobium sp.]
RDRVGGPAEGRGDRPARPYRHRGSRQAPDPHQVRDRLRRGALAPGAAEARDGRDEAPAALRARRGRGRACRPQGGEFGLWHRAGAYLPPGWHRHRRQLGQCPHRADARPRRERI